MDESWSKLDKEDSDILTSILQGEVIRDFRGLDGQHFRFASTPGEGRYVFSAGVDWYNPLGNKASGRQLSLGVITMMCLNLPLEIRNRPENVFVVGIIPGPGETTQQNLNAYLSPWVDRLLELWDPGVFFTRTCVFPQGRLVRCALVCVVCDLPAARKMAGCASAKHRFFCSKCWCRLKKSRTEKEEDDKVPQKDKEPFNLGIKEAEDPRNVVGLDDYDCAGWIPRTHAQFRDIGNRFKKLLESDTPVSADEVKKNQATAKSITSASAMRCTELSRLPYFDIPRMIVVDPMHNLFLGLLRTHFRFILGIDDRKPEPIKLINLALVETSDNPRPTQKDSEKQINKVCQDLETVLDEEELGKKLSSYRNDTLLFIAKAVWGNNFGTIDMCGNLVDKSQIPTHPAKKYLVDQCKLYVRPT